MSKLDTVKTLMGVSLRELPIRLDEELPSKAYKAIPGASYLTDINPAFMRDAFNTLFGPAGYGWGYEYKADDVSLSTEDVIRKKGQPGQYTETVFFAQLRKLIFWYMLDDDGKLTRHEIPATGASDNKVAAYALKGAITAALGNAASNMGWQKSVYMGERSHNTVRKSKRKATARPASKSKATAKPAIKPKTKPAPKPKAKKVPAKKVADVTKLTLDSFYKIPVGRKAGEPLAAQDLKTLTAYTKMSTRDSAEKQTLKKRAVAFLARKDRKELQKVAVALLKAAQSETASVAAN